MKSLTVLKSKCGFTLIEILVVMSIVAILLVAGFFVSFDSYNRESISAEHTALVSTLEKARSRAMNNINQSRHGVHIEDDSYVVFREFPYNPIESTNEEIPRNSNIIISGLDEVIFEQLSGETNDDGTITLTEGPRTKNIEISENGLINW